VYYVLYLILCISLSIADQRAEDIADSLGIMIITTTFIYLSC
jgi:hypothetical protein